MAAEPNPLSEDPALFDMYMTALDRVMARPEIRSALADLRLPGSAVRSRLLIGAHRVLSLAPDEYAAYRAELSRRTHVGREELPGPDPPHEQVVLRYLSRGIAGAGIVIIAFGALARWWDWSWIALWAGGSAVTAAAAAHLLSKPRIGLIIGHKILLPGLIPDWYSPLTLARDRLIVAVSRVELLAQVRTLLNTMRENRFDHAFSVSSSPGLSEVYDSAYNVDTHTIDQVDALIRSVAGISLGIAGPRGSGKSTIVRRYCSPGSPPAAPGEPPGATGDDLRCMVSAPVDYAARDFVLHLFATFCRAVVAHYATPRHAGRAAFRRRVRGLRRVLAERAGTVIHHGLVLLLVLVVAQPVSVLLGVPPAWVAAPAAAPALFGLVRQTKRWSGLLTRRRASRRARAGIVAAARRNLLRVRFLQSRTLGWSSGVKLAAGFEGQVTGSVTHAEQPLSYPEVVEQFRSFAHRVATFAHARGENVFVGVDELDKIGSADQAERFLNEIKGIFGVPHVYFMISVSDDALMAFERRGIPARDAFDSSFDEIARVGLLDYAESRRLLYRRVIGLSEPYIALCHVLSGGLARDLIRSARQLVRIGASMMAGDAGEEPSELVMEADRYVLAMEDVAGRGTALAPPSLGDLCSALVRDELTRKARAIGHALGVACPSGGGDLEEVLYDIGHAGGAAKPPMEIVDAVLKGEPGESADAARLRLDFAAYAYFCSALHDVFGESLGHDRMRECAGGGECPGSFDALANARHAFVVDPRIAWARVTACRRAWHLEVREIPG